MQKKTSEEYNKEVFELNSNIEVVGEYINNRTKILHRCKIDGYEWYSTPSSILSGCGCPKCGGKVKKTQEEYIKEVSNINPNIEVLGNYDGMNTKILHRCKIDSYEWNAYPNHILRGSGCPVCSGLKKKTHEEYVGELNIINSNIEAIEEYINAYTPIFHKCKIDGYEWRVSPHSLLCGSGCPMCYGNIKKTHEQYVDELSKINPNVEVLGKYTNNKIQILHRCKVDSYEWKACPSNMLYGKGCPKCNASKGERTIENWLNKENILYKSQWRFSDCKDIKPLPFDFYLPKYDICIEYQGQQHYEIVEYFGGKKKFEDQIKKDNIKKEYCKENNIQLFIIPYFVDVNKELIKVYEFIKTKDIEIEREVIV